MRKAPARRSTIYFNCFDSYLGLFFRYFCGRAQPKVWWIPLYIYCTWWWCFNNFKLHHNHQKGKEMCVKTSLKPAKFRVMLVSVKSLWVDFLVKSKIQHHIGPWLVIYSCFQIWIDLWFESGSVFRPFQNVFMQSTLDKDTIYRWCVDIVLFLVMDFWRISTKKSGHFLVHHCPCRLSILINAAHFCRVTMPANHTKVKPASMRTKVCSYIYSFTVCTAITGN